MSSDFIFDAPPFIKDLIRTPFFPDRVRGGTLSKKTTLIFHSKIPHDESINVIYNFSSGLHLFSRKFEKTVQDADDYKMAEI